MTRPFTDQRLDEIAARAESVREYIDLPDDVNGLAARDVPDLIDEIRRQRAQNTAGQAGLRDRIRRAFCEAEGFAWDTDMLEPDEYCEQADAVLAVLPAPADRAAVLREAADHVEAMMAEAYERALSEDEIGYGNGLENAMQELRRLAAEAQPATETQCKCPAEICRCHHTPAAEAETDEQRADREETERDHTAGNHQYCGLTCEVEYPTEALRNFILAKGYPGTAGLLAELERRAAAEVGEQAVCDFCGGRILAVAYQTLAETVARYLPEPEDPARIDCVRPEFTEHSSIEAIDAQLWRARAQQSRWHLRTEWLISLRAARVAQKERGEWPAAGARQDGEPTR